ASTHQCSALASAGRARSAMATNTKNTGRHAERGRDLRRSIVVSSVGNIVDMWCLELSVRGWPLCRYPSPLLPAPEGRRKRRGEPEARDMIGLDPDGRAADRGSGC